jgi:N-acetylmuramic acid 6-phosphate (MurNAc-6-P) etherase
MSAHDLDESKAHDRQIEIYRQMTPAQRIAAAMQLSVAAREIKAAALRAQHPDWSDDQVLGAVREAFLYART